MTLNKKNLYFFSTVVTVILFCFVFLFSSLHGQTLNKDIQISINDTLEDRSKNAFISNKFINKNSFATLQNLSLQDIESFIREAELKINKALKKIKNAYQKTVPIINKLLENHPDMQSNEVLLLEFSEILYYAYKAIYQKELTKYQRKYNAYLRSPEFLSYASKLKSYYTNPDYIDDTLELFKPKPPVPPSKPAPKTDQLIEIYDNILNIAKDEKFIAPVLFAKGFLLGEGYGEYSESQKIHPIEKKREESSEIFKLLVSRYPRSNYAPLAYFFIAEYYFNSNYNQPKKTLFAIPYYHKAIKSIEITKSGTRYYQSAIYKLAYSYFRINNYENAVYWFNLLIKKIEEEQKLYGSLIPSNGSMIAARAEVLKNIAECFEQLQSKIDPTKSATSLISDFYRLSIKKNSHSFIPFIYQELGELYKKQTEYEKVRETFTELLQRYPDYEHAPYIVGEIIELLKILVQNREFTGSELELLENQLYKEREKAFYRYGKNFPWYKSMQKKLRQKQQGFLSPEESSHINSNILKVADELGKDALFNNIISGLSRAQLYEGALSSKSLGIKKDTSKSREFYDLALRDINNYLELIPMNDPKSYYIKYQKALILHQKKGRLEDAFNIYLQLAKNPNFDFLPSSFELPNSPLTSYKINAITLAYEIADSLTKMTQSGFYNSELDTLSTVPDSATAFTKEEKMFTEALHYYLYLLPFDSLSHEIASRLSEFYLLKGRNKKFQELQSILAIYYPLQKTSVKTLVLLSSWKYQNGFFEEALNLAKATYNSPGNENTPEAKKLKSFAYSLIGSSIAKQADKYKEIKDFANAGRAYERILIETPNHENALKATRLAFAMYDSSGHWQDAIRMARAFISKTNVLKDRANAHLTIVRIFDKQNMPDSVISTFLDIANTYAKDSSSFARSKLLTAIPYAEKHKRYSDAISLSNTFIEKFPDDEKATYISFNKINIAKLMKDDKKAFDEYENFALLHPDHPLAVEAYYRRAKYAELIGDIDMRDLEYQKTVSTNASLPPQKRNNVFASEALWILLQPELKVYQKQDINFYLKNTASRSKFKKSEPISSISFDIKKKKSLYDALSKKLINIIKLGGHRALYAYHLTGTISRDFATAYETAANDLNFFVQTNSLNISNLKLAEAVGQANENVSAYYKSAASDYFKVFQFLDKQSKTIKDSLKNSKKPKYKTIDSTSYQKFMKSFNNLKNSSGPLEPILARLDTLSNSWIVESGTGLPYFALNFLVKKMKAYSQEEYMKHSFSSLSFKEKNISNYTDINVPDKIRNLEKTVGKGKNKIIVFLGDISELNAAAKFISTRLSPATSISIEAYASFIKEMETNGIKDSSKIKFCLKKIASLIYLPIMQMDSLSVLAKRYFGSFSTEHDDALFVIDSKEKQTRDLVISMAIMKIKMTQTIQLISTLTNSTLAEYNKAYLTFKDAGVSQSQLDSLGTSASKFIYEKSTIYNSIHKSLKSKYEKFNADANKFIEKDWFGRAANTYSPLKNMMLAVTQNILSQTISIIADYNIQNEFTAKSLNLLVETDRAKYLSYLGDEAVKYKFFQGGWKYKLSIPENDAFDWQKISYSFDDWQDAIQKPKTTKLEYLLQQDTSFVLKKITANTYWIEEEIAALPIDSTNADTTFSALSPFGTDSTASFLIQFNRKNKITNGLEELTSFSKKLSDYLVSGKIEIIVSTKGLSKKQTSKGSEKRFKAIRDVIKKLNPKLKILLSKKTSLDSTILIHINKPLKDESFLDKKRLITKSENFASQSQQEDFVYMKTSFEFEDAVKFAQMIWAKNTNPSDVEFYINDIFISPEYDKIVIDSTSSYSYNEKKQLIFDITNKIIRGKNVIAIKTPKKISQPGLNLGVSLSYYGAINSSQLKKLEKIFLRERNKYKKTIEENAKAATKSGVSEK